MHILITKCIGITSTSVIVGYTATCKHMILEMYVLV